LRSNAGMDVAMGMGKSEASTKVVEGKQV
jgi:hypothetical protein